MPNPKISVVIATYNMRHLLKRTIESCCNQEYPASNKKMDTRPYLEVLIYDDCSTDGTEKDVWIKQYADHGYIKYYRGQTNKGVGGAFNEAIALATGDIIVLICSDDLFTHPKVLSDIAFVFKTCPTVGHVSRWDNQFVDGYEGAVRAWRTYNVLEQANNPSGLAFRREALIDCKCSNHMFIETTQLVKQVLDAGWKYHILKYDTIAVRVHQSTSTQKGYWLKRRVSSPIADWVGLGCKDMLNDHTSLVQIKCNFTTKALLEEIGMFIKLRPSNLLMPGFWFYAVVSLLTPRFILRQIPQFYRHRIGRLFTKEVKR
jgi:glycosyltransferase involved in cell wall biosynthesis